MCRHQKDSYETYVLAVEVQHHQVNRALRLGQSVGRRSRVYRCSGCLRWLVCGRGVRVGARPYSRARERQTVRELLVGERRGGGAYAPRSM